jgi:membrane-bound lytic murein transglycosylase D
MSPLRTLAVVTCAGVLGVTTAGTARAQQPHPHAKPTQPKSTGKAPKNADVASRRAVAGGSTVDDIAAGADTPELRALREAEKELFPPAMPALGTPWPAELPSPLSTATDRPIVHASGVPPTPAPPAPPADSTKDTAWLAALKLPDLAVRWDPRVIRYLEFFKDDPRGRATFAHLYKRSGRYRDVIRRALKKKALPEDLLWVSMIESAFDPTIRSHAGAVGLWQFMPETGKIYGLSQDRWVDMRMSAPAASLAAADFFSDLHRRFGSWELSLAAYDMGFGAVQSVVRRYNTNDFWALSKIEGALPWETTLYVPKILAVAIISKNLQTFGFGDLAVDGAIDGDDVRVAPGTPLSTVAAAAGCTAKDLEALNPELRAGRTPPVGDGDAAGYVVSVPHGKGVQATDALAKMKKDAPAIETYVVRFGETIEQVAVARRTSVAKLVELNDLGPGEVMRGGTVLLVPRGDATSPVAAVVAPQKTTVVVPPDVFAYPDRKHVFYRVLVGDTIKEIAAAFHVTVDDLRRWNDLDPVARLIEGMTLQIYVPSAIDLGAVVALGERDVRVVAVGTDEFFTYLEQQRGQKRIVVTARAGDTLDTIGKRYQVPAKTMERMNRKARTEKLDDGESVVVYVPTGSGMTASLVPLDAHRPTPNGPLPYPPVPDLLPDAN